MGSPKTAMLKTLQKGKETPTKSVETLSSRDGPHVLTENGGGKGRPRVQSPGEAPALPTGKEKTKTWKPKLHAFFIGGFVHPALLRQKKPKSINSLFGSPTQRSSNSGGPWSALACLLLEVHDLRHRLDDHVHILTRRWCHMVSPCPIQPELRWVAPSQKGKDLFPPVPLEIFSPLFLPKSFAPLFPVEVLCPPFSPTCLAFRLGPKKNG